MTNYVRPRIDGDLLIKIRLAYPQETAEINTIEGLVVFSITQALEAANKVKMIRRQAEAVLDQIHQEKEKLKK